MRYIFLYFFQILHVYLGFLAGLPEALHSYLHSFLINGISRSLFSLFAVIDSCEEDGEEVDEDAGEEELADNPRTTNGT